MEDDWPDDLLDNLLAMEPGFPEALEPAEAPPAGVAAAAAEPAAEPVEDDRADYLDHLLALEPGGPEAAEPAEAAPAAPAGVAAGFHGRVRSATWPPPDSPGSCGLVVNESGPGSIRLALSFVGRDPSSGGPKRDALTRGDARPGQCRAAPVRLVL